MKKLAYFFVILLCSAPAYAKKHYTEWSPDTCPESSYLYEWDDTMDLSTMTFTFVEIKKPCIAYKNLVGEAQYSAVTKENLVKNRTIDKLNIDPKDAQYKYDETRNLVILNAKDKDGKDLKPSDIQKAVDDSKTETTAVLDTKWKIK